MYSRWKNNKNFISCAHKQTALPCNNCELMLASVFPFTVGAARRVVRRLNATAPSDNGCYKNGWKSINIRI